jgi:hypothetical protein
MGDNDQGELQILLEIDTVACTGLSGQQRDGLGGTESMSPANGHERRLAEIDAVGHVEITIGVEWSSA